MTIAVADALMDTMGEKDDVIKAALVDSMQKWRKIYPDHFLVAVNIARNNEKGYQGDRD